jgi:hypothetical protein
MAFLKARNATDNSKRDESKENTAIGNQGEVGEVFEARTSRLPGKEGMTTAGVERLLWCCGR